MIGHGALPDGLNKYENHDRIEAELKESIDVAAECDVPGLICFSGNRNDGQSDYEGMIACARGLRRIAPYAEEKGVNLNVELLNSKVNHPGYQCDHTDWGLALCEMVDSPRVKLLYDIYHMQIMEGDIIRNISKGIDRIGHFHTAGNPGRNDMDDTQEMNYRGICKAIADTGYDLYVGHEFSPKGDPVDALKETFEICDQG
jgi:hydroxypyruvate isomerase